MEKFPVFKLHGTPAEIGQQHGRLLKDRIPMAISFYRKVFGKTEQAIFEQALHFKSVIIASFPEYAEEIEGIAEGAGVDPRWIYALNARSEIITMFVTECTALFGSSTGVLAQNWDWAEALEELAVILEITRADGHRILMLTEPGIIGKIGLNSKGLGVTLNFLYAAGKLDGLPIHITLRALLDSTSFEAGKALVSRHYSGKGGNIIWASQDGSAINFEFANSDLFQIEPQDNLFHTNHYLSDDSLNTRREKLASSLKRFETASEYAGSEIHPEKAKEILLDQSNLELPICRPYIQDIELGNIGTVCTLIMDLKHLEMFYTPGNPFDNDFTSVGLI